MSAEIKMSKETTLAMEEINIEVNSINEAITIIDQIAFQTINLINEVKAKKQI